MDKMYDVPKKKSKNLDPKFGVSINKKSKPKTSAKPEVWGAGDPNYIKNMIAAGKARRAQLPKKSAKDNSYVDRMYGPIAGSAE